MPPGADLHLVWSTTSTSLWWTKILGDTHEMHIMIVEKNMRFTEIIWRSHVIHKTLRGNTVLYTDSFMFTNSNSGNSQIQHGQSKKNADWFATATKSDIVCALLNPPENNHGVYFITRGISCGVIYDWKSRGKFLCFFLDIQEKIISKRKLFFKSQEKSKKKTLPNFLSDFKAFPGGFHHRVKRNKCKFRFSGSKLPRVRFSSFSWLFLVFYFLIIFQGSFGLLPHKLLEEQSGSSYFWISARFYLKTFFTVVIELFCGDGLEMSQRTSPCCCVGEEHCSLMPQTFEHHMSKEILPNM